MGKIQTRYGISREEQDAVAVESHRRAALAIAEGRFKSQIVPIVKQTRKGEVTFDTDEHVKPGTSMESLAKMKPAFKKDGTVTAGNASGINDGAAAVVVMSEARAKARGTILVDAGARRAVVEQGKVETRAALRDGLAALKAFKGATGDLTFSPRRVAEKELFFLTVDRDGLRELTRAELLAAPGAGGGVGAPHRGEHVPGPVLISGPGTSRCGTTVA